MLTALDLADNWLNLLRLELNVYIDNERAVRLYRELDFEIEGRKRCYAFRGGAYIDSYLMGRLNPRSPEASRQRKDGSEETREQPTASPQRSEHRGKQQ